MLPPRRASSWARRTVAARSGSPAVRNGMKALRPCSRRRWKSASMGFMVRQAASGSLLDFLAAQAGYLEAILVAAAGEADHDHVLPGAAAGDAHGLDHGVGRLQGRQDALQACAQVKALQGVGVVHAGVAHPPAVLPVAVLRA